MTIGKIKELLHAVPFKPFTVRVVEQVKVRVPHPDFALLTKGGVLVVNTAGEKLRHIDVRLIGSVATAADATV